MRSALYHLLPVFVLPLVSGEPFFGDDLNIFGGAAASACQQEDTSCFSTFPCHDFGSPECSSAGADLSMCCSAATPYCHLFASSAWGCSAQKDVQLSEVTPSNAVDSMSMSSAMLKTVDTSSSLTTAPVSTLLSSSASSSIPLASNGALPTPITTGIHLNSSITPIMPYKSIETDTMSSHLNTSTSADLVSASRVSTDNASTTMATTNDTDANEPYSSYTKTKTATEASWTRKSPNDTATSDTVRACGHKGLWFILEVSLLVGLALAL